MSLIMNSCASTSVWCFCDISPHIRRSALDEVGGWDSYNVTEDADLSFRLAAKGCSFGYVDFPTDEEAVSDWRSWHYQRVRWMKGYM